MKVLPLLPLLSTVLVAGAAPMPSGMLTQLRAQQPQRISRALETLMARRAELGLDSEGSFQLLKGHTDELGQTHGRFQQLYKGVPVFGGEAITHMDAEGASLPLTNALMKELQLNVTPSVQASEALGIAHRDLAPKGPYAYEPSARLVVYPIQVEVLRPGRSAARDLDATGVESQVVRYALAWHVETQLQNGKEETRSQDYMIDAHTGAILKSWNSLETGAATGTGNSQWYGTVNLNTNNTGASAYEMRDLTRGNTSVVGAVGNATTNLNHKTTSATGTIYTDTDNVWGDGGMYGSGTTTSTTSATGQTAAVDAHRGLQATWDFYQSVFGRNGIDDTGKATYSRMHYGTSYDNAFWSDSCFCMTYGDGDPVGGGSVGEADLDTAGHEMSHGVCANEANLTYSSESGGLNESNSDIFGTMVEFYTLGGGTGSTIPDSASIVVGGATISANYKMFENSWGHAAPNDALRWMYRPNLDGASPNYWYSGLGSLDVHYSSGANNRFFFFLAAGATTSGDTSTAINTAGNGVSSPNFLPNGMNGIGNDSAARIWYRTLTTYLTSSSTYAQARTAALSAATDLFGANSFEYLSVQNAYHGVNVGAAATLTAVKASITAPASNQTINSGDLVAFTGTGKDTIPSVALTYAWDFGDGATASGASPNHSFTNSGASDVTYTVTLTVTDANSASASATCQVTVHPAGDTTAPTPGTPTATGQSGTITFAATPTDDVAVTKVEFYVDGVLKGNDTSSPFSLAFNSATLADGAHTLTIKAFDAAGNNATSSGVSFSTDNTAPSSVTITETGKSGTIALNATASDNVGVQRVQFYIDSVGKGTDYSAPYGMSLDSVTKLSDGNHSAYATAFDAAGNKKTSSSVVFSISNTADTTKPVLSNLAVSGTTGMITFSATATDDHSVNTTVGFYVDGAGKGTDYFAPYALAFDSTKLSNGTHTLMVKSTDAAGNSNTSSIQFSVSN